jgi:hypothetical protein
VVLQAKEVDDAALAFSHRVWWLTLVDASATPDG